MRSNEVKPDEIRIPGFVDLQVNGHRGVDFSSPELTIGGVTSVCEALRDHGVAGFLPTIISSPPSLIRRNSGLIARAQQQSPAGSAILGIHLEGPFLETSKGSRGAHRLEHMSRPSLELLNGMVQWCQGLLRLITVSPGLPGIEELIRTAVSNRIAVSLGHHNASRSAILRALEAGATAQTHLGNGIAGRLNRTNNALFHVLAEDRLAAMIIADGHHLPQSFLQTVWEIKGRARTIMVSDQSPITGLPPGRYRTLGNDVILDAHGKVSNPAEGHLVGSGLTIDHSVLNLLRLRICDPVDIGMIAFENPLRLINIPLPQSRDGRFVVVRPHRVEVTR